MVGCGFFVKIILVVEDFGILDDNFIKWRFDVRQSCFYIGVDDVGEDISCKENFVMGLYLMKSLGGCLE